MFGTEAQKLKYLPALASGEHVAGVFENGGAEACMFDDGGSTSQVRSTMDGQEINKPYITSTFIDGKGRSGLCSAAAARTTIPLLAPAAFALTEPQTGSDAASVQARFERWRGRE